MKRFLYYDEDSVNSFLAQIERGVVTQERSEGESIETKTSNKSIASSVTGDLSAKVIGIGASLTGDIESSQSDSDATSKLVKGVQEKILHDYAFEKIYDYFKNNNLIVSQPGKIGDIVQINEIPTFLDFEYFQNLFSDDGVIKYAGEQNRLKVQETISELKNAISNSNRLPPEQKAKVPEIKSQIKQLEEDMKQADLSRKDTERMIKVFRKTIPYNHSLMTEHYLVPCDDNKFRDDPNIVAFKYGGSISILGYITNVISEKDSVKPNNDFAGLYSSLNSVMLGLFKNKDRIFILHPIALFY